MLEEFKTKDATLKFIKKLSFNDIKYNRIQIGKRGRIWWVYYESRTIEESLLKNEADTEEKYIIYCVNNYHNIYMNYRGEPCDYQDATIFNNKDEAHKFLREKETDDYYLWSIFNIKDLREDQKQWQR